MIKPWFKQTSVIPTADWFTYKHCGRSVYNINIARVAGKQCKQNVNNPGWTPVCSGDESKSVCLMLYP